MAFPGEAAQRGPKAPFKTATLPKDCGGDKVSVGGLSSYQIGGMSRDQMAAIDSAKNVPILEKPYTKILEAINVGGLEMETWHTCKTTHCVGGWTVTLAPGGKEFEAKWQTANAARMILSASRPGAPLPNFTASNEAAMAFIEARAAEEI